jgi:hypothetical protein
VKNCQKRQISTG